LKRANAKTKDEQALADLERRIGEMKSSSGGHPSRDLEALEQKADELHRRLSESLTPWQRVQLARHPHRPFSLDYIRRCFTDFIELHGDRAFGDDPATVAGLARLEGRPVVVIGQQKGRDTSENIARNFGMPHPEGYRKALRLMRLADRFAKPVITFIDTPGAYPGVGAEERGQAEAIARNLLEMSVLKVPVVAVVIGEGGSGGALGIGVANRVLMMENAVYSVISPEGCAAILWDNREMIQQASEVLKMTARDLLGFRIVDGIVPEPAGGAHRNPELAALNLKKALVKALEPLCRMTPAALEKDRFRRFRGIGRFQEKGSSR
jgi:acetyl-CoA carboxylase carboxyl transferase subunit alpha